MFQNVCSCVADKLLCVSVCVYGGCVQEENKNEAMYLREHRGELVEELAKTIVEKVRGQPPDPEADMRNWHLLPCLKPPGVMCPSDYQQEEILG